MSRSKRDTNLQLYQDTAEICQPFYLATKNSTTHSRFLMRIPKRGLPFLYILYLKSYCKKTDKYTFVRFIDYYLNISLWGLSFSIFNFITLRWLCLNLFTICLHTPAKSRFSFAAHWPLPICTTISF